DTARNAGQKIIVYSTIFSAALALVFALGAGFIPRIFPSDADVLNAMAIPWWIMIAMIIAGGVLFAIDGVLLGAGDAAFLRTITIDTEFIGFCQGIRLYFYLDVDILQSG